MRPNCSSSLRSASSVSDALEAGVVRDLVVARERGVHGGAAAHHVREDAVDDQVADDHAHRAADERVDAAAVAARPDVAPDGAERCRPLEDDLPAEEHERARDVEAVREERAVARVRLLLGLHAADREDDLLRLAREQVAAARAAVDQQADAGGALGLDARAVGGRRAGREQAGLLVHPPERGDVLVRAEQDAGLARAGLRREIGLPLGQLVACPPRASGPSCRRCRPASPAAAPAARARRSRGR